MSETTEHERELRAFSDALARVEDDNLRLRAALRGFVERWRELAAVEREIRLCSYTSAGDPARMDDTKMFAIWAGRLQKAIGDQSDGE